MFNIIDAIIGMFTSSKKRSKEVNTKFHIETVKPLKSRYSYASEVDKRDIERAMRRRGQKR